LNVEILVTDVVYIIKNFVMSNNKFSEMVKTVVIIIN
jgi:hypothetical protein